jgi:hypothetical protein
MDETGVWETAPGTPHTALGESALAAACEGRAQVYCWPMVAL